MLHPATISSVHTTFSSLEAQRVAGAIGSGWFAVPARAALSICPL